MMFSDINPIKDSNEHQDKAEELSAEELRKDKRRAYYLKYYHANKEKINERRKHNNKDKARESRRKYYHANKEKIRLIKKAYYEANKGNYKAYREANKEKISLRRKAYREANIDKVSLQKKVHYEANKEKISLRKKAANLTLRGYKRILLNRCRKRSRKKCMEFNLTLEWVSDRIKDQNETCAATGHPFNCIFKVKHLRPYAPSIHRTDPNKGYTRDNCAVVCYAWNRMVGDSTDGITQTLIKSFIEKTKKEARESKKACPKTPSLFSSLDNSTQNPSDGLSSQGQA